MKHFLKLSKKKSEFGPLTVTFLPSLKLQKTKQNKTKNNLKNRAGNSMALIAALGTNKYR